MRTTDNGGGTSRSSLPPRGTVLGFDFGTARIGVAVAELELGIAHPLETVRSTDEATRDRALDRLVREWRPVVLVIGLPESRDGRTHPLAEVIGRWAESLGQRHGVPIRFEDESFTSAQASSSLNENGIRGMKQKRHLDTVAAQHILQAFLESRNEAA